MPDAKTNLEPASGIPGIAEDEKRHLDDLDRRLDKISHWEILGALCPSQTLEACLFFVYL